MTGFPPSTLRYYEDQGLLPPPARTAAGHRLYGQAHIERLRFMSRGKRLGLTLEETAALADAWAHEQCSTTHQHLNAGRSPSVGAGPWEPTARNRC